MKKEISFENFYRYDGNRVAYLAAQKIIQFPGEIFNPFYVYSSSSLGKTHLLWAMYGELKKKTEVLIFAGKEFEVYLEKTNEFHLPVIVDDINLISEKYQDKILSMIDIMLLNGKQMCFSGNTAPRDLRNFNQKIISRLEGGLVCDIQSPKEFQLVEFIKKKSEEKGLIIPDEIALELTHLSFSSLRTIEGMINRLAAYASLGNVTLDLNSIRFILKEFYPKGIYSPFSSLVEELKKSIAEVLTGVTEAVDVRSEYKDKIYIWEMKGFDTSTLKPYLDGDPETLTERYNDFLKRVERLIELQKEFGMLDTAGAPEEAIKIETMLFSPDKVSEIENLIEVIKKKLKPKEFFKPFENFLVGGCNKTAYELYHKTIIPNLGRKCNPFVIFGKKGTGKTYFLKAVENDLQSRGLKVMFCNPMELTNIPYENLDGLLIDNFSLIFSQPDELRRDCFELLMNIIKNDRPVFIVSEPFSDDVSLNEDEKLVFELGIEISLNPPSQDIVESILKSRLKAEEFENILNQGIPGFDSFYEIDEYLNSLTTKPPPEISEEIVRLGLPGEELATVVPEEKLVPEGSKQTAEIEKIEEETRVQIPFKKLKEEKLIIQDFIDELVEENY